MPNCTNANNTPVETSARDLILRAAIVVIYLLLVSPLLRAQVTFLAPRTTLANSFIYPEGVAVDRWGNLYISDTDNQAIKEILAVNGGIPANPTIVTLATGIGSPSGIAVDVLGNVYFCGYANSTINEILAVNGRIPTHPTIVQLGSGFDGPQGVAVDRNGDVFVADYLNGAVKEILAVNGAIPASNPTIRILGSGFFDPIGVAVDASGDVYVADSNTGIVSEMVAVNGGIPASNPTIETLSSDFSYPNGLAVDGHGNVFVTEGQNTVKEILASSNQVRTLVNDLSTPWGVAVDPGGNLYVAEEDSTDVVEFALANVNIGSQPLGSSGVDATLEFGIFGNTSVGSIGVFTNGSLNLDFNYEAGSTCTTGESSTDLSCKLVVGFSPTAAGLREGAVEFFSGPNYTGTVLASVPVYGNGTGAQLAYQGGPAIAIAPTVNGLPLNQPSATAVDGAGDLFILDTNNNRIVEVPANGDPASFLYPKVNGQALTYPQGIGVDGAGNLYVADPDNGRVLELPAGGGPATAFAPPGSTDYFGPAIDGAGNLYFGDIGTQRVLEFPSGGGSPIAISPVVNGVPLGDPTGVALDAAGDLFLSDLSNGRVVELFSGGGTPISFAPFVNEELFSNPRGIAVDAAGNIFVAEESNNLLIEIPADGTPAINLTPTVNGLGLLGPTGVTVDSWGNVFVTDTGNNRVIELQRAKAPSVSFATATKVGTTDSTDGVQTVQLTNIGNQNLDFTALSYPADFSASSADLNPCTAASSLIPGQSCDLPILFTPINAGAPLKEAIQLTDNSLSLTQVSQQVAVTGTATAASPVVLSATSLSFGSVDVGSSSASQYVTLTNKGTAALTITSITVTGTNASSFVFGNTCGTSLAAGANCSIHGHFAPTKGGALTAAVTITDSASNSPQTIALSGTGVVLPVTLSAVSLSYGSVEVGAASGSQSVTLTNTGSAALSITSIALSGADASSFVFANTCGTSLAVGADCTIHGHFAPTTGGSLTAAIKVTDSASTSPQTIALSGTGVEPPVTLSATKLSYATTKVGSSSGSQFVTMTNTGTATLTITSIAVTGADASSFVFANTCGTSLAVGASCSIHGHFAPTTTGALTAAVTITDSAAGSPQSIALSGTGQ